MNDAFRSIPGALFCYACDWKWWGVNGAEAAATTAERWNQIHIGSGNEPRDRAAAERFGLRSVRSSPLPLPFLAGDTIAQGKNSGFQALNLAVLMGARDIVLCGFDMRKVGGKSHYFGDHKGLNNESPFGDFIRAFDAAAPVYARAGVRIINTSLQSALACFVKLPLERVL